MRTNNLGYPRIGSNRELKKACENYWAGKTDLNELLLAGKNLRKQHWLLQQQSGIDLIPSNDFSFYDQVLDMSITLGAIPERFHQIMLNEENTEIDLLFAMARGYQKNNLDITAMEMTKWFDTNYHYIVPEFYPQQEFRLFSNKIINEFVEAKNSGIITKPVIIGAVSFLLLGKVKEKKFNRMTLLNKLLPVYIEILGKLEALKVEWIQFDEPFLMMDLNNEEKESILYFYTAIKKEFPFLKIMLTTYFGGIKEEVQFISSIPICALHVDLIRCSEQLDDLLQQLPEPVSLSLGIVDGRNIWKNDYSESLRLIAKARETLGKDRIFISASCSLLHVPCDLETETGLHNELKENLSFAKQKLAELQTLKNIATNGRSAFADQLKENQRIMQQRKSSTLIHNPRVKQLLASISDADSHRETIFSIRKEKQKKALQLPLFPTTTIGSFPQTTEVRSWRNKFKKGEINEEQYITELKNETKKAIQWQEEIGLDVLVHGEFERNDMVEYFGEQLDGFAFTQNGWVQSYGSRCVKPPIIFGDVSRVKPMTVFWSQYAQSISSRPVKGMLTGPVTILQWSFVRNDQPRSITCMQIALAIREEVTDLENAGIKIIQIDEPAIREGLPLKKTDWNEYLNWAVKAFRIASSGVKDETQIHTHMCYAEFNDIIKHIAEMDADVITLECSRSQMELLEAFSVFQYPNDIGPGVYDIHSPRIPTRSEMLYLIDKACKVIPSNQVWVNPDCGLKTRHWEETKKALTEMVKAAVELRKKTKTAAAVFS